MSWLTFTLLAVVALGAVVFSGGALLWVGARLVARLDGVPFRRCLGTYVFAAVLALLGYFAMTRIVFGIALGPHGVVPGRIVGAGLALGVVCWVVKMGMGRTYRQAALVLLPLLGQVVAALVVVLAATAHAQSIERRAACRLALAELGRALAAYAERHDGHLPADLAALREDLGSEWAAPRCPAAADRPDGGYFYFAGAAPQAAAGADADSARRLLGCDLAPHGDGRNVLTADGWSRWLAEAAFQAALAEPRNAAFAEALRAAQARGDATP